MTAAVILTHELVDDVELVNREPVRTSTSWLPHSERPSGDLLDHRITHGRATRPSPTSCLPTPGVAFTLLNSTRRSSGVLQPQLPQETKNA